MRIISKSTSVESFFKTQPAKNAMNDWYNKIKFLFLVAFITTSSVHLDAVNAYPGIMTVRQPDGSEIRILMKGNAFNHVVYSTDGFPLVMNDDGYYVFAGLNREGEVFASDIKSIETSSRTSSEKQWLSRVNVSGVVKALSERENIKKKDKRRGPGLMSTYYPTLGEQKALVILVEFADKEFSMDDPKDFYTRMLNEPGYADNGGTGSARDYFIDNSSGEFIPSFDVYGPVKLKSEIAFYGQNDRWGDDTYPYLMVIEACRFLDNEINFREYDRNGDGEIDNVFVYYAGYGENDGGGANTIWPHSSKMSLLSQEKTYLDGVLLERYACSNELHSPQRNGLPDGIGTFCHEFGHVLGLPDLYATTFINLETPGEWDVMDTGNYNNEGNTPANLSAFERYALDWLKPKPFVNGDAILEPIDIANEAYIYQCKNPDEYFLFENRQQQGWDNFLPGHGMLVWQINYDPKIWAQNIVNNSFLQQYVDLIEADGMGGLGSREGDPFPGSSEKTAFSSQTSPAFRGKSETNISVALSEITETEDGNIRFVVTGSSETTGVDKNEITHNEKSDCLYDLTGRKIKSENPSPGIYIRNGKKVILR